MNDQQDSFKILTVDDNPTNIKVICGILQEAGYQFGVATNGREALEVLMEEKDYDLVLMDINMPEVDGFQALELIHEGELVEQLPVIMLTASNNVEYVVKGFELGAVDYITKPFHSKELLSRVNTQLQLKRKNDQLKSYACQLEHINATKDKFFSIISHDLRNPIGSLQIISRMLKTSIEKKKTEQTLELMESLDSTINLGYKLLENLLQWARSQTGRLKITPMELNLSAIADEVIELTRLQTTGKNITFDNRISEEQLVFADQDLLKTILRNLITNASKYCNTHTGIVIINSWQHNGFVHIQVTDNGIGMDEDTRSRLFIIEGNITSRPGTLGEEGTGLGLILCREFVEKMGGSISVESEPGKGSTFTFSLPSSNPENK